VGDGYNSEQLK